MCGVLGQGASGRHEFSSRPKKEVRGDLISNPQHYLSLKPGPDIFLICNGRRDATARKKLVYIQPM